MVNEKRKRERAARRVEAVGVLDGMMRRSTQYERVQKLEASVHEALVENVVLKGLVPTHEADLDDGLERLVFLPPPAYREATLADYSMYGDTLAEREEGRRYEESTREDGESCTPWAGEPDGSTQGLMDEMRARGLGDVVDAVKKGGRHG